jgi:predicted RecA/RadA family phage recombinase
MNNYIGPGEIRTCTNGSGGAWVSGQVVVVGKQIGVCTVDIANGASGEVAFVGRFTVPKVSAAVFVNGENVAWDASTASFDDNLLTLAAGDVSNAATAAAAGSNGQTTMDVILNNRIGTVT